MPNTLIQKDGGQLSLLAPPHKQRLLNRLALSNRILLAEPIAGNKAIVEGRYGLRVSLQVPGQWRRAEVQRVLELTEDWSWGGVLDLQILAELESLLSSVASEVAK